MHHTSTVQHKGESRRIGDGATKKIGSADECADESVWSARVIWSRRTWQQRLGTSSSVRETGAAPTFDTSGTALWRDYAGIICELAAGSGRICLRERSRRPSRHTTVFRTRGCEMLPYGRNIPSPQLQVPLRSGWIRAGNLSSGRSRLGLQCLLGRAILIKGKDVPSIIAPFRLDNQ